MATYFIRAALVIALLVMVSAQHSSKPGVCPPVELAGCIYFCGDDDDCIEMLKCCYAGCGSRCIPVSNALSEKKGSCPSRPTGPWVCSSICVFDGDCTGSKKCCKNRCGAMACMKPEL